MIFLFSFEKRSVRYLDDGGCVCDVVDVVVLDQGLDDVAYFGLALLVQRRVGNTVLGDLELAAAGADQNSGLAALVEGTAVDLLGNLLDACDHDLIQDFRRHVDQVDYYSVVGVEILDGIGDGNGIIGTPVVNCISTWEIFQKTSYVMARNSLKTDFRAMALTQTLNTPYGRFARLQLGA